ncbi:MAG: roadblock/LC7 domain-containing protein [Methanomassiliicoccales archaeon]|nr:MAG: roadblock/LC7 domain-containing protein [Methanomassiliicoccales archaeon]
MEYNGGSKTSEVAKLNEIVTQISRLDKVESVFAASRAGVFTTGSTPNMTDRAMFSAIASMMLGAAEQLGREMGDDLDHVLLELKKSNMLIIGAGPKHIIGLEVQQGQDVRAVLMKVKEMIANGQ